MIGLSSYVLADAVILACGGVLRGAGDTRWLMVASVSLHWAMLVAQFFIIRVFDFSPKVSWLAFDTMIGLNRMDRRIPYVLVAVVATTVIAWLTGFERHVQVPATAIASPPAHELIKK